MNLSKNNALPTAGGNVDLGKRSLLMILAALPAACVVTPPLPDPHGQVLPAPAVPPKMRLPQVGQEWVYAVRNVYNQQQLGIITERVVAVGDQIRIQRTSDKIGVLPDEIQGPWGMILQDPHWTPAQTFAKPLPLWPLELRPGWTGSYRNQYAVLGQPGFEYFWILNMEAVGWEEITTPAGKFKAFKFNNRVNFQSDDLVYKLASERSESVWLVPEIGRWVMRRSTGSYFVEIKGGDVREEYLEWELLSWK